MAKTISSLVQSLWPAGAGSGRPGYDGPGRAFEYHADVVVHDDGIRAAAGGLRSQQPQLFFRHLKAAKECVINIPTVEIAEKVVGCGNVSGADVDKFEKFQLTPRPASLVGAPLVDECYANLECRVADTAMVAKYGFFILEVVKAWIDPKVKYPRTIHHLGMGSFMVAGERIRLKSQKK